MPTYTPPVIGQIVTLLVPMLALESPAIGRRLHQVCEGLMHIQRCRELFTAAMCGVDNLMDDPEGDRLLLRGEEVIVGLTSPEENSGESEGEGVK